jgi:hypothetical protein
MSRLQWILVGVLALIGLALALPEMAGSNTARYFAGECAWGFARWRGACRQAPAPPAPAQPGVPTRAASANAAHDAAPIATSTQITGA